MAELTKEERKRIVAHYTEPGRTWAIFQAERDILFYEATVVALEARLAEAGVELESVREIWSNRWKDTDIALMRCQRQLAEGVVVAQSGEW